MTVNLRFMIILASLIVALPACQIKGDMTPTLPPLVSATLTPSFTPGRLFNPTLLPSVASTPAPFSYTPTPFDTELTLEVIGRIGGWAKAVAIKDRIAYLGVGPQVLVLDISDPSAPRQIRQTDILSDTVEDIVVTDNLLYIAAGKAGLHILDVSDPTSPNEISFMLSEFSTHRVIVHGDVAFVAESQGSYRDRRDILRLIDVADPAMPREIARLEGQMVNVGKDYAYINQGEVLRVIDASELQATRQIANTGLRNVRSVVNGYAYTVNSLRGSDGITSVLGLVDISDPNYPQDLGSLVLEHTRPETLDSVVAVDDSLVYVIACNV